MIRFSMKVACRWMWTRRKRCVLVLLSVLLLASNALAFMHAGAMTHFVNEGSNRTASPESLTTFQRAGLLIFGVSVPRPTNAIDPSSLSLPYTTHRIPIAAGQSLEAWHIRSAEPKGLVMLCHGYAAAKSSLIPAAVAFGELGYDTLLLDFRGSGGSTGEDTTIGYREADDVAAAVTYVRSTFAPQRLVLYGQSMGAVAILRAVGVKGVTADALVLESPFDRLLSTVNHRFEAMGLPAFPMSRLLVLWGGLRQGYWAFDHNPQDYARRITIPTLVMHGQHDPRVTPDEARQVAEAVAGPKRFVLFPNAGHLALVEADVAQWRNAIAGFISGVNRSR
jgi:alpha-beta hydrolase superfamily lysophospholipase